MVYNPVTNQAHSGLSNHYLLTTSRNRFALDQCIRLTKGRTLKLRRFVKALLTIHTKWTQYTSQFFIFTTSVLGGKYLFFVSSRSVKMRGFSFLSFYKSGFIFQFLNVKMYNYGKQNMIVNFIIKKLKKTQFPQKV